jgi:hypothetical protein
MNEMGLLQNLKNVFSIIGVASVVFIVSCVFSLLPSKFLDSLPTQIQQVFRWTGGHGLELLGIFAALVASYVTLKVAVWLRKRENRSLGGLPI